MSERISNPNRDKLTKWAKKVGVAIVTTAALSPLAGCSTEAAPAPTVTVTKTVEATPPSKPEASKVPLTDAQVDQFYNQATDALKQGDLKTAENIYPGIIVTAGTEKDYDGDGDKELPYEALEEQINKAK